jgi:hypothetical protein
MEVKARWWRTSGDVNLRFNPLRQSPPAGRMPRCKLQLTLSQISPRQSSLEHHRVKRLSSPHGLQRSPSIRKSRNITIIYVLITALPTASCRAKVVVWSKSDPNLRRYQCFQPPAIFCVNMLAITIQRMRRCRQNRLKRLWCMMPNLHGVKIPVIGACSWFIWPCRFDSAMIPALVLLN